MNDDLPLHFKEIAQRREADEAKRARFYQLIGELSSVHNEVTGEFSGLFFFLLGADWRKAMAILKDHRHLDQKVKLIDHIVGLGDETNYVKSHWDAIKRSANLLNGRRGQLIHAAVSTLLHDDSGASTVTVLAVRPGRMYSEEEIQASVTEEEIADLITQYRGLYLFVSLINQAYALKADFEEDADNISADLIEKQHQMLAQARPRFLPD